jgi:hypothetical protein
MIAFALADAQRVIAVAGQRVLRWSIRAGKFSVAGESFPAWGGDS